MDAVNVGPGLYSFGAKSEAAVADLGLEELQPDQSLASRVLYVGKAEDSLSTRLAGTHFAVGRSGHSTVRRTLGALLCLEAIPRSGKVESPTRKQLMTATANFAFTLDDDRRLSEWMFANLDIRTFATTVSPLAYLERAVGRALRPPLDQDPKPFWTPNPWRPFVASARKRIRAGLRLELGLD